MPAHFFDKRSRPGASTAKKLFIDIGSNYGQSVEAFCRWKKDSSRLYDIYCFEPNLEFIPFLLSRVLPLQERFSDLQIIPMAAHTLNGFVEFDGWQLSEFGKDVAYRRRLVPALDFSEWFSNLSPTYNEIIVKMDIEGAEYKIIPALACKSLLPRIDQLFIEIHGSMSGHTISDTNILINTIYRHGLSPYLWECDHKEGLMHDPEHEYAQIIPNGYISRRAPHAFNDHAYIVVPSAEIT
jgi:FkbM family methyltransferase